MQSITHIATCEFSLGRLEIHWLKAHWLEMEPMDGRATCVNWIEKDKKGIENSESRLLTYRHGLGDRNR